MVKFTNEQRLEIIKHYYKNSASVTLTLRSLTPIFGRNTRPSRQAIHSLVNKFESTYSLLDVPVPVRKRTGRSAESITAVKASLQNKPNLTIPCRARELGISQSTLWRILREDLGQQPYKIKLPETSKSKQTARMEKKQESEETDEMESSFHHQGKIEKAKKTSETSSNSKSASKEESKSRSKKPKSDEEEDDESE